jgi:ABC-type glutathione transport system ATPase component
VSFDLTAGEALGLVGEPGSDKGTIAGAILDLLSEDRTDEGFPSQNVTLGNLCLPEALGIGDRPAPPGP